MANTKKVRILEKVGNPRGGAVLAPGATVDLPEVWADRFIAQGKAELVTEKKAAEKPAKKAK